MFVYVMGWNSLGPVKIGISRDVAKRQAWLQCALPFPCYMLFSIDCGPGGRRVEAAAHKRLADQWLHGEWFDISVAKAIDALREISGQQGKIDEWVDHLNNDHGTYFAAVRARATAAAAEWAGLKRTRATLRQRKVRARIRESGRRT